MKKQIYKIDKSDWLATIKKDNCIKYFYAKTKKEALEYFKKESGIIQIFKLSHEFRDVKKQGVK